MASANRPTEAPAAKSEHDKSSPVSGISQFLGRVLEQLSLSSWMPAAMLVCNAAVLIQMHSADNGFDIAGAFADLTESPLGVLVVFLLALVLATVLIQAFEFESIRLIEGYLSHSRGPCAALARRRIRRHSGKRSDLHDAYNTLERAQFARARAAMLQLPTPIDQAVLDALERDVHGLKQPDDLDPQWLEDALALNWTAYLAADDAYQLDAIDSRLARYPAPHRVLPTRLGNAMRAAEDTLTLADDENLEGYVLRHHEDLPGLLKNEHHDYRTRLEMYAGLMFVFVVLAAVAIAALAVVADWWQVLTAVLGYLGLAWVSYEACIASALGYGDVLQEINRFVTAQDGPDLDSDEQVSEVRSTESVVP